MRRLFKQRFLAWLQKRIPAGREQNLTHQKIFILPSRFGVWFLLLCALLFVLGTNYQNNLMKLLCTFLLSLFLLHLFISYINFSRLRVKTFSLQPCFASSSSSLPVAVEYTHKKAQGIVHLSWWNETPETPLALPIVEQSNICDVPFTFAERGIHALNRVTLRCDYPLGLFKCWTHLDFGQSVTVYPKPKTCSVALQQQKHSDDEQGLSSTHTGNDEFYALRDFTPSDPMTKVAWKQVAKDNKWKVKTFDQQISSSGWLTFASTSSDHLETALAELTHQILHLSAENQTFGLALPGVEIAPQQGEHHKHECLQALACYPKNLSAQLL